MTEKPQRELLIDGPEDGRDGHYMLVADDGEYLYGHYCSSYTFAPGDLILNRPERRDSAQTRYGDFRVAWTADWASFLGPGNPYHPFSGITSEELVRRNHAWGVREGIVTDEPQEEARATTTLEGGTPGPPQERQGDAGGGQGHRAAEAQP